MRFGSRGDQQGTEGVLAHRPGEAEERVDEHRQQQHDLQVEHQHRRARGERQLAHQLARLLGGAQHSEQPADDEDRRRGEERRAGRQVLDHDAVDHACVAVGGLHHPLAADSVGAREDRRHRAGTMPREPRIARPAAAEKQDRAPVEPGQQQGHFQQCVHGAHCSKGGLREAGLRYLRLNGERGSGGEIEDDDLGVAAVVELEHGLLLEHRRIAGLQRLAVHRELAAHEVDVGLA